MAKFIQVRVPAGTYSESTIEETNYYVNVDLIRYVAQNTQNPDRSSIRFVSDDRAMQIGESAASFVRRACAD